MNQDAVCINKAVLYRTLRDAWHHGLYEIYECHDLPGLKSEDLDKILEDLLPKTDFGMYEIPFDNLADTVAQCPRYMQLFSRPVNARIFFIRDHNENPILVMDPDVYGLIMNVSKKSRFLTWDHIVTFGVLQIFHQVGQLYKDHVADGRITWHDINNIRNAALEHLQTGEISLISECKMDGMFCGISPVHYAKTEIVPNGSEHAVTRRDPRPN